MGEPIILQVTILSNTSMIPIYDLLTQQWYIKRGAEMNQMLQIGKKIKKGM